MSEQNFRGNRTIIGLGAIAAHMLATNVSLAGESDYRLVEIRGDGRTVEHVPALQTAVRQPAPKRGTVVPEGICGSCASNEAEASTWSEPAPQRGQPAPGNDPPEIICVPLVCDTDVEFFEALGSVEAVEARVRALIDAVNVQFERDVGIRHEISEIVVRTAEPDPYSTYSGIGLASQFRQHWLEGEQDSPRGAALLLTGRTLSANVVGWAWRSGSICTDDAFAVAAPEYSDMFVYSTDLVAHELGHLWDASHCICGSPPGYTMNPIILGNNQFHPQHTVPSIVAHRDSRPCVSICSQSCLEDCAQPRDGVVDVVDLLGVLSQMGDSGPCAQIDLPALLAAWGQCP